MIPTDEVVAATEQRFADCAVERETNASRVSEFGVLMAADADLVARRVQHALVLDPTVMRDASSEAVFATIDRESPIESIDFAALERIIGANDQVAIRFLAAGLAAARPVARIGLGAAIGAVRGWGTGSMVSPSLLLTNHHVLESDRDAADSVAEFDYELLPEGGNRPTCTFALEPHRFFLTSVELDFSLVAVAATSAEGGSLAAYGWNPFIATTGKVLVGDKLNIIQHPEGRTKVLALRENKLLVVLDDFLQYETDTNPGSSGSPVFNDQWELVALHHSGVPQRDAAGNWLATDGSVWTKAKGEDAIAWIANEGVRISRIVAALQAASLSAQAVALRQEALTAVPPTVDRRLASAYAGAAHESTPPTTLASTPLSLGSTEGGGIHIHLHIHERPPAAPVVVTEPSPSRLPVATTGAKPRDLVEALTELSRATDKPYYDQAADEAAAADYYTPLGLASGELPAIEAVRELIVGTHTVMPRYRPAVEVYPWIDLQPDLRLTSIYSNQRFDPSELIVESFRLEAELASELAAVGPESFLDEAARLPYNCEHVVPQSWFEHAEPMRGDLHHLFTCESRCNSFRSNRAYHDFTPVEEAFRDDCGQSGENRFEPEAGKGAAARASLYIFLRYPEEVDWSCVGDVDEWLATLTSWHEAFPVTDYERHRNAAVQTRQGTRNPWIDHPDWWAVT